MAALDLLLAALVGTDDVVAYHDRIDGLLMPLPLPLAHYRPVVEGVS